MTFLSDIVDSFNGNKSAAGQAIVKVGNELSGIEEWIKQAGIDSDNVHVAVGMEIIERDVNIYEKAYKLLVRFDKTLSNKWDKEIAADLHTAGLDLLVMKYNIAVGEGFDFNEENSASFPEIAKLAGLDKHGLLMYFQESVDSIQALYEKYFPRG